MPASTQASVGTTRVHEIYIRATAQAIWDAITSPEWNKKYGYSSPQTYDLRPGGAYKARATAQMIAMGLPETVIDGEVIEAIPPKRLVQTFRFLFTEENRKEGFTRMTWEIVPAPGGFCRLTLTHEQEDAPIMAAATASLFSE